MSEFYIGQKVICIDNSSFTLKFDTIYTVINITDKCLYLEEFIPSFGYFKHRFVDAEKYLYNQEFNDKILEIINE